MTIVQLGYDWVSFKNIYITVYFVGDFNIIVMIIDHMTHVNKMLISKVFPSECVG